jgi:hypothetical protein
MRHKRLLIGTLLLGLITLTVLNLNKSNPDNNLTSKALIDSEILNHPAQLVIKSAGKTSTIENLNGEWIIKERFNLPIDVENRLLPSIKLSSKN